MKSRGLDAKGNKALLKERLIEALAAEKETTVKDDTGGANDSSDDDDADDSISEPVLAKITHHDYSNKIKDKMAKFTKR